MNNNLNLTEEYKTEISSILTKISQGLSTSVTENITPSLNGLSESIIENSNKFETVKEHHKLILNEFKSKIEALTKDLNDKNKANVTNKKFEELKTDINQAIRQNNIDFISSVEDVKKRIDTLEKYLSESITKNTVEQVGTKITNLNKQHLSLLNNVKSETTNSNNKLEDISKSISDTQINIEESNVRFNSAIKTNKEILLENNKQNTLNIKDDINSVSTKIHQIGNDKSLECEILDLKTKQVKTDKLIYTLIAITISVLISIIGLYIN